MGGGDAEAAGRFFSHPKSEERRAEDFRIIAPTRLQEPRFPPGKGSEARRLESQFAGPGRMEGRKALRNEGQKILNDEHGRPPLFFSFGRHFLGYIERCPRLGPSDIKAKLGDDLHHLVW